MFPESSNPPRATAGERALWLLAAVLLACGVQESPPHAQSGPARNQSPGIAEESATAYDLLASPARNRVPPIPQLVELFELRDRGARELWVEKTGRKDSMLINLLGVARYHYQRAGDLEGVREWTALIWAAAEAYDEKSRQPSDSRFETKERLLASAHLDRGDDLFFQSEALVAVQHYELALSFLETSRRRRREMGIATASEFDRLFSGGEEGLLNLHHLRIFEAYKAIGDEATAAEHERLAYEAVRTSTNLVNIAAARLYEAARAEERGDFEAAIAFCEVGAAQIFDDPEALAKGGFVAPLDGMVHLYRRGAGLARAAGMYDRGLALIDRAIALDEAGKKSNRLFEDHLLRALLLGERGEYGAADQAFEKARSSVLALEPTDQLRFARAFGQIRLRQARALQESRPEETVSLLRSTLAALEEGAATVEAIRPGQHLEAEKIRLGAEVDELYSAMIEALALLDDLTKESSHAGRALEVAEQASARAFLESMASTRSVLIERLPEEDRLTYYLAEKEYLRTISSLYDSSLSAEDRAREVSESEEILAWREGFFADLRAKAPEAMELLAPRTPKIEDLISGLPADVELIRYFVGEESAFAWTLDHGRPKLWRLGSSAELLRLISELLSRVTSPTAENQQAALSAASKLSRILLEPMRQVPAGRKVLLVPHGALYRVPFDMLPVQVGTKVSFLIEERELFFAPSISVFRVLRTTAGRNRPAPPRFLGVGDPSYRALAEAEPGPSKQRILERQGLRLGRLPGSRGEVEAISRLFESGATKTLLGDAATKARVVDSRFRIYSFVHFAVHGLIPGEISGVVEPTLVLSPASPTGTSDQDLLTFSDILRLGLNAYMTVLSACNTAVGPEVAGEGAMALTRSVLVGGSDHVVVSLWPAEDRASALLMEQFYRHLVAGEPPAGALRKAKLHLLRQLDFPTLTPRGLEGSYPSGVGSRRPARKRVVSWPYLWGNFALFGSNGPATFVEEPAAPPLGSREAPVRCHGPAGQREYLDRLRCSDGRAPSYKRVGNVGRGAYGNVVDHYQLHCEGPAMPQDVYMDLYFPGYAEPRAIPGFAIEN